MKVAYLLGSLNRGGAEMLLLDVLKQANESEIDAGLIHRNGGSMKDEFYGSIASVHQLAPKHIFDLTYLWKLRQLLISGQFVIAHAQQPIDALYAYLASIGTACKIVLTWHGYDFAVNKVSRLINRVIIKRTQLNIFVSNPQKVHYVGKYLNDRVTNQEIVIHNGVNFNRLAPVVRSNIKEELAIADESILLGSIGSFVGGRDQMTICRFLNRLHEAKVDFTFVFVGRRSHTEPHLYDDCVAYCSMHGLLDKVFFLGTREDVPAILKQLDAFIYSTIHDTFGIAVVEAMASGIPVFVNDWDVMLEITGEGQFATLYTSENEEELLEKFTFFLRQKAEFGCQSAKNAAIIKQIYSLDNHLRALTKAYKSVLTKA